MGNGLEIVTKEKDGLLTYWNHKWSVMMLLRIKSYCEDLRCSKLGVRQKETVNVLTKKFAFMSPKVKWVEGMQEVTFRAMRYDIKTTLWEGAWDEYTPYFTNFTLVDKQTGKNMGCWR
jgi:hypothetical protein